MPLGGRVYKQIEKIGRKKVNQCKGLPLAIIVLGGILVDKETPIEWKKVSPSIKSSEEFDVVQRVLALSYQDLPYKYKPYFLYLSHFPEDSEILAEKLCKLWMAEGFLLIHDRGEEETMLDVAARYLAALAQMIQVQINESTGRIKSCRIHHLMREMCILKAREQNFVKIIHLQHKNDLVDFCSSTTPKIRRLAIHLSRDVKGVVLPDFDGIQHLRSLLLFSSDRYGELENYHFKNFKLLKVLDLEGFVLRGKSVEEIRKLIALRYLGLQQCTIMGFFPPISMLQYVETLDLRSAALWGQTTITLQKMERLRHLYVSFRGGWRYTFKLHVLSHLGTLEGFYTGTFDVNDLCKLDNVRQLVASFYDFHNQDLATFVN
ncbi:hypothetical protein NMG60_11031621 [Bertholletia excelsa]